MVFNETPQYFQLQKQPYENKSHDLGNPVGYLIEKVCSAEKWQKGYSDILIITLDKTFKPVSKLFFTCSFDDGDVADLRLADLIRKYNLKGTFYIPQFCNLVAKSLSENEIRDLANLVEIGGHTMSHQVLTNLDKNKARSEIFECKDWLENVIGKNVSSFCPPNGRFGMDHIVLLEEAGFKSMRTVEMLSYSFRNVHIKNDLVILPTSTQVYNHHKVAYVRNALKRLNLVTCLAISEVFNPCWHIMSSNLVTSLLNNMKNNNSDYFFHLWGHSWEIEKYSLWNSLEEFFKKLSQLDGTVSCTNAELGRIVRIRKANG